MLKVHQWPNSPLGTNRLIDRVLRSGLSDALLRKLHHIVKRRISSMKFKGWSAESRNGRIFRLCRHHEAGAAGRQIEVADGVLGDRA
jgi:hypothetical protein